MLRGHGCCSENEQDRSIAISVAAYPTIMVAIGPITELAKKVRHRLRDSACWRSGEITQPRTNFFGQLCTVCTARRGMGIRQGRRLISIQRNATARQHQQRTAIGSNEATASEGRAFSLLRACKKIRSPACLRVRACILAAYILGRIDETIVN